MSEIFETVNTHADLAQQIEQRRRENIRRTRRANKRMLRVLVGVVAVWLLVIVLRVCGQIAEGLADFIINWAGCFLTVWVGAWFQFCFCRKGLIE